MKFKVGDKVRVIDNGLSYTTYPKVNDFLIQAKNPKPYNYNVCIPNGEIGVIKTIKKHLYSNDILSLIESGNYSYLISLKGIEFIESQTEFTFQEVIARIKPGEIYEPVNGLCITQTITMDYEKDIIIEILPKKSFVVPTCSLFKLQEPKKQVKIIKVEHGKGRKQYEFIKKIDNQSILVNDMVECNTKYGNCYGRCVDIIFRELTEQEIKQYKECWRA